MGGSVRWMAPADLGEVCHLLGTQRSLQPTCQLHTIEFLGTAAGSCRGGLQQRGKVGASNPTLW